MVADPAVGVVVPPRPLRIHRRAAEILGEQTLRERGLAPFDLGESTIALATADPDLAAVARFVQHDFGYAAQTGWETPDLVEQALTAHYAPDDLPALIERQATEWLRALGGGTANDDAPDGDEEWLEALSLAVDLPAVRLDRVRPNPALARLLPERFAREHRLLPLLFCGGVLFLATATAPDADLVESVEALIGPAHQFVLAASAALSAAIDAVYPSLTESNAADENRPGAAPAGWDGDEATRDLEARARALGLPRADLGRARLDPVAAALMPRAICEQLGAVVLSANSRRARIAVSGDDPHADAATIEALIGRLVEPSLAVRAEVLALIAAEYPAIVPPLAHTDLFDYLARARPEADAWRNERRKRSRGAETPDVAALLAAGVVTLDDVAELKGMRAGLPWLRLRHVTPSRDTLAALDRDIAHDLGALPLRRQGAVLHVAVATLDSLPAIERACGCAARPVLAERSDLDHALARLYDARRRDAPELERLLDRLRSEGRLDRRQRSDILAAHTIAGTPADVALTRAGVGSQIEVANLLAAWTGTTTIDLRPRARHDRTISPLGAIGTRAHTIDPVDRAAAALLPGELAERLTALPVQAGGNVTVAVADPLDREAIFQVEAAVGRPIAVVVSPRGGLEAAIRRAYGQRNLGDHLVERGLVTPDELVRAIELHDRTGVRIGKALLTLGYITQEQLTNVLAEQLGLPYFDIAPEGLDREVAALIPEEVCRWRGVLPLAVDEHGALLAMTDPLDGGALDEATLYLQRPVQPVLVTERQFDEAMEALHRDAYLVHSASDLLTRAPDDSAFRVLSRGQKYAFAGAGAAILIGLVLNYAITLGALVSVACVFYFAFSAYKLFLIYKSLARSLEVVVTPEELAALDDRDLPVYSVLVPMYKEGEVLPILVDALDRLDYPKTKLEVLLLLEEDDTATVEAARRMRLPEGFRVLVVPHGQPKGKPKACNYGLLHARGEFVVLYDAEDVPEPDQLKKALIAFRRGGDDVVTVQAKLNYFNRDQNLLTRWFTSEYAMWFDLLLPGLDNSGAPIPLGGTSNHFRAAPLRELGGWDPFNVTEDADLGIRLFKRGYRTCVVNSTTYEEANSQLGNWIRQRSRWIKGYMQTWLVHMRHPLRLLREVGLYPFLSLQMIILGTFFAFLLNPVFWGLTALWFLSHWGVIQRIFPGPVFYLGTIAFYFGNFAFIYINVAGALRREYHSLVKYVLLTPIYWALMSIAAWKALYQLIFRPSYWEKTDHGLYRGKVKVPGQQRTGTGR